MQDRALTTATRRSFLRSAGLSLSLPALEAFLPSSSLRAKGKPAALATTPSGMPLRTAFLYKPNGVNTEFWNLKGTGRDYQSNATHQPYEAFRDQYRIFGGLAHLNGTAGPDGPGDHARANATFLTGVRPYKTAGANLKLGISADQVLANQIGHLTRFSSLELSCDSVRKSGFCDNGYSCAYQFNLSWRDANTPMTPETQPRMVFERLFGAGGTKERGANRAQRKELKKSILDFVSQDIKSLQKDLGKNDQARLEEYLTGVRDLEKRVEKSERFPVPDVVAPHFPEGDLPFPEHVRLMMDMVILAFETDSTRVASLLLSHDGSNRSFAHIGVPDGHHNISHHQNKDGLLKKLAKIDLFYSQQFAYFLRELAKRKDPDGTSILHNSQIIWGSGLEDPNKHRHDNLPIILAGNAGGGTRLGTHDVVGKDVPVTNLFLGMFERAGLKETSFGDSTGVLSLTS